MTLCEVRNFCTTSCTTPLCLALCCQGALAIDILILISFKTMGLGRGQLAQRKRCDQEGYTLATRPKAAKRQTERSSRKRTAPVDDGMSAEGGTIIVATRVARAGGAGGASAPAELAATDYSPAHTSTRVHTSRTHARTNRRRLLIHPTLFTGRCSFLTRTTSRENHFQRRESLPSGRTTLADRTTLRGRTTLSRGTQVL